MRILLLLLTFLPLLSSADICTEGEQLTSLAINAYHEDRGSVLGMTAVSSVVINRSKDNRWPVDLCEIIFQPSNHPQDAPEKCAFSWACDDKSDATLDVKRYSLVEKVISDLMNNESHYDITMGAVYYYRCELHLTQGWMKNTVFTTQIGKHCFYK